MAGWFWEYKLQVYVQEISQSWIFELDQKFMHEVMFSRLSKIEEFIRKFIRLFYGRLSPPVLSSSHRAVMIFDWRSELKDESYGH